MPSPDDLPVLERARAEAARRLAERAGDPAASLAELRDLQERLRLIEAGLSARAAAGAPPRPRRLPPALWPALAVAAVLSVAAAVPVRSVPFTLEARAHAVALQFDAAGVLGPQPVDGELRIEGHTRLESPVAALTNDAAASGAGLLLLRAPQLILRRVSHPAASRLVVRGGPQVQLTFEAPSPVLRADIEFAGLTRWRVGDSNESASVDFAHAEWVRASAGDTAHPDQRPAPLDLWLGRAADKTYAWTNLRPVALQFVDRRPGDAGQTIVASSLEQAQLALPITATELKLGAGDRLEVAGLELERFELAAGDSVALRLSGTARVLTTRTGDFERSLKPSLLEYIARHHTVSMFWSAALFLWGAITWVRKQFDSASG